jgi:hypothetical protein
VRRPPDAGGPGGPGGLGGPLLAPSVRYATGVDRRDVDVFLSAFLPDATLTIPPASGSAGTATVLRGHAELGRVVERIRRYDRTFHLLGQVVVDASDQAGDDDVASAEVYCIAHHWRAANDATEHLVMYIRYQDDYRRLPDGDWRIATRTLHVDGRDVRREHGPTA